MVGLFQVERRLKNRNGFSVYKKTRKIFHCIWVSKCKNQFIFLKASKSQVSRKMLLRFTDLLNATKNRKKKILGKFEKKVGSVVAFSEYIHIDVTLCHFNFNLFSYIFKRYAHSVFVVIKK